MSDAFSDSYETKILTQLFDFNVPALSIRPSALYLTAYTSGNAPTDSTFGTDISGGGFARQAITMSVTNNVASNTTQIVFPTASSTWGLVTHVGIVDDLTASNPSNLIAYSALATQKQINANDVLTFLAGQLTLTLT